MPSDPEPHVKPEGEPEPELQLLSVEATPLQSPPAPSVPPARKLPVNIDAAPVPPSLVVKPRLAKQSVIADLALKKMATSSTKSPVKAKKGSPDSKQQKMRDYNRKLAEKAKEKAAKTKAAGINKAKKIVASTLQSIPTAFLPNMELVRLVEFSNPRPRSTVPPQKPPSFETPAPTPDLPVDPEAARAEAPRPMTPPSAPEFEKPQPKNDSPVQAEPVPVPEPELEPDLTRKQSAKKLNWRTKKPKPPPTTTYSAAGTTFSDCPAGELRRVWATDEVPAPASWVPEPKALPAPTEESVDEGHVKLMEAKWSVNWAQSELASKLEQKVLLENKLQDIRNELAALQREAKSQRPRPPSPLLQDSEMMARGDLMSQFLSPEEVAKESREVAKANRRKGGQASSGRAGQAVASAMTEKALVAARARERAAVRALDACLVTLQRAEKEAAKAQEALEGQTRAR